MCFWLWCCLHFLFDLKSKALLFTLHSSEAGTLPPTHAKEQPTCHPITGAKTKWNEMMIFIIEVFLFLFFSNAKQNNDTERLWYCFILCVTKQRKYAQISLNYLSWKIYFKKHNWEMKNKMQFMNDCQGLLTPRRCKKASSMLRNECSQTHQ